MLCRRWYRRSNHQSSNKYVELNWAELWLSNHYICRGYYNLQIPYNMFVNFTKNVRLTKTQEMVPPKELVLSTSFVSRMEPALLVGFYGSILKRSNITYIVGKYLCLKTCISLFFRCRSCRLRSLPCCSRGRWSFHRTMHTSNMRRLQ